MQVSHLFHPLACVALPGQILLKVAYSCYHRFLRLTGGVVPFAPALALLGTPRGPKIPSGPKQRAWHAAELYTLGDLYDDGKLIPFPTLVQESGLPAGQFLLYNSLLRSLTSRWGDVSVDPSTHLLVQYIRVMGQGRHLLRWFTDALRRGTALEFNVLRVAWDRDATTSV
ncbi:hypothetical protein NDU88_002438 [Pleurodeles waltl]|uniref:Uncharacterized protein n=1 Tax=Pleurodeles waltl TaxID=8319 RepID=A0AAV7SF98_PLEWA|nr:hypothetical protein NDU88_002438 [Pleurodeles waltl]